MTIFTTIFNFLPSIIEWLDTIYQEKYGAKVAVELKMYIDEIQGEKLIKKYLNTDSNPKIDIEDE